MKEQLQAVRGEKWKLYLPYKEGKIKLTDLSKDIKEEHDLSEQYPEVVQRILQHAEKIRKELGDTEYKGRK